MKTLMIVRHAKSSWEQSLGDFDRPLNDRGFNSAPTMGQRLKAKAILPDLILSSPALRALTTARLIAQEIDYAESDIETNLKIYEATTQDLVDIVRSLDDAHQFVMMVGHNPGFTDLNNYLTQEFISNMSTCGMSCLNLEIDSWCHLEKRKGAQVFYDFPKNQ